MDAVPLTDTIEAAGARSPCAELDAINTERERLAEAMGAYARWHRRSGELPTWVLTLMIPRLHGFPHSVGIGLPDEAYCSERTGHSRRAYVAHTGRL